MTSLVLREDRDGLAMLTLNRPEKLNALSIDLFLELSGHLDAIAEEVDNVGLVLLRGAGRCFSAGNDLAGIGDPRRAQDPSLQSRTIEKLERLPQPVLAAVHGHCIAGALELALAADLIIAAESAQFGDAHARWGLTPIWGLSQRLPRRVGQTRAREMVYTCRRYSGAQAVEMGLANACVPDETLEAEAARWSAEILAQSWHTHRAMKALFNETDAMPLREGLAWEVHRTRGRAPDAAERMGGFLRK